MTDSPVKTGSLSGITVVELAGIGPGPYAAARKVTLRSHLKRAGKRRFFPLRSPALKQNLKVVVDNFKEPAMILSNHFLHCKRRIASRIERLRLDACVNLAERIKGAP